VFCSGHEVVTSGYEGNRAQGSQDPGAWRPPRYAILFAGKQKQLLPAENDRTLVGSG